MCVLCAQGVSAQFYDWGVDPAHTKWRTIKTPEVRYVFPREYERQAVRVMHYLDTIRPHISYGFRHGPMMRTPMVLHTRNYNNNGIVMLAPRRIELVTTPSWRHFAMPTLKQLAAHEYRHAVQYNNLNQGLIKALTVLLGQQGNMVGLAFMPVWAMEGDAVMAETSMSTFGRGLQPSWTIEYRAMVAEGRRFRTDKYFSGSYRDFMPDHYQLGYQIMSWSWGEYGENILDKTSKFTSRNPWMIFPFTIALKKYYKTGVGDMFTRSFDALEAHWRSLPTIDNSAEIITTPIKSHTTYSSPRATRLPVTQSDTQCRVESPTSEHILAFKADLDKTTRLVVIQSPRSGRGISPHEAETTLPPTRHSEEPAGLRGISPHEAETTLARVGQVNSPLTIHDGKIYWTEIRNSTLWEQKTGSVLCYYDPATGQKGIAYKHRNVMFPVSADDLLTWVEYHAAEGVYSIAGYTLPDTTSVHGLTYEGGTLYYIGLDDSGMWIGAINSEGNSRITQPTRSTLSNLSSGNGRLYFGSIASGRDEVHMLDLQTLTESRVTTSRYGSFDASPASDSTLLLTTYTPRGYLLSTQKTDSLHPVPAEPLNILNPAWKWDVPNLDNIVASPTTERRVKKYRRGAHLFNFHSWAPAWYDPERIASETRFDLTAGLTTMSQNALNTAYTELAYGYTGTHSVARAKFKYYGWAPKIELEANWVDTPQVVYNPLVRQTGLNDHFELSLRTYLPLTLSSGSNIRTLTPSAQLYYMNARVFYPGEHDYDKGLYQLSLALSYSDLRRLAHRDFRPPLGYTVRVGHLFNPMTDKFSELWSASARVYLPGMAAHHSLMVAGAVQHQNPRIYAFGRKDLFPRGATYNGLTPTRYRAMSADYALPLGYPDWGWNSFLFIKRVRLNVGFDAARFQSVGTEMWHTVTSYGGDLTLDIAPLRLPATVNSTLTVSYYRPSDGSKPYFNASILIPL